MPSTTKVFQEVDRVGTAKYTVSFHDGVKTHGDGSPFFDIAIFRNKKKKHAFVRQLRAQGYRAAPC